MIDHPKTNSRENETPQSMLKDEREKENNLVIYNIAESSSENPNIRESYDTEVVHDIFYHGMQTENYYINKVIRLGKKTEESNKPRPILVKLSNPREKWNIIKKC